MKKIATIALGLGLILGLTTATFAADKSTSKAKTTKAKSTKAAAPNLSGVTITFGARPVADRTTALAYTPLT